MITTPIDSVATSGNGIFLEQLYAAFLQDPASIDQEWRTYFETLDKQRPVEPSPTNKPSQSGKQAAVSRLISAYRFRGHRRAHLDPLELYQQTPAPDLEHEAHGLTETDLDNKFNTGALFGPSRQQATLREILHTVRQIYCGTMGVEYMYLTDPTEKEWIRERLETPSEQADLSAEKKRDILKWLTAANQFETYLHKKYVGQKRFSLEGGESLIPLLDEIIQSASTKHDVREIVIGMAHRGRLNVLVNTFGKRPGLLFSEFEGKAAKKAAGISGDVKYHLGFSSEVATPKGHIHIALAFNPSHLEIINPTVEGSARARQARRKDAAHNQVVPLLIHGDASFAGQGVIMETLNLSGTRGYGTGGTIHVVINNQIGFTTSNPLDSRSTLYCTDVAKMVQAPIFHVNGEDPESTLFAALLALDFRMRFNKDVVIDMVCYRRHGHNESDEPLATQPMMYKKIEQKPDVRQLYADRLVAEGTIKKEEAKQMVGEYLSALEEDRIVSRPLVDDHDIQYLANWKPYLGAHWTAPADTGIPIETVEKLGLKISEYPADFVLHQSVERVMTARREMALGERPIDWGFAEILAYASLLRDGYSVRLSGQDCERGTFFHRHSVLHNQEQPGIYRSLEHLFEGQPRCQIINSLLSEEAVLGFEYGYSSADPECLVIWEGQFGDFVNGAQVVIDQFLSSSEAKWEHLCGLVLFLPHGYDGQGPEHSSARLERFLQLAAQENFQICVPSTPAQMFHMLRRQMHRHYRKPLIVMTPKSLLRHRLSIATREELTHGGFQTVIDEVDNQTAPETVIRVILCAGKVYYDLLEQRRKEKIGHIALVRLEQLYPFPREEVAKVLTRYPSAVEIMWAQEEPRNQGAWDFIHSRRHLAGLLNPEQRLSYAGRPYAASPAAGSLGLHRKEQTALLEEALTL